MSLNYGHLHIEIPPPFLRMKYGLPVSICVEQMDVDSLYKSREPRRFRGLAREKRRQICLCYLLLYFVCSVYYLVSCCTYLATKRRAGDLTCDTWLSPEVTHRVVQLGNSVGRVQERYECYLYKIEFPLWMFVVQEGDGRISERCEGNLQSIRYPNA